MKVVFQSFYLYLLGVVADAYRIRFNRAVQKAAKNGDISSPRLAKMSDRSYCFYKRFYELENRISREIEILSRAQAIRL